MAEFTPTEQRLMAVLADGRPHTREELHGVLPDELSALSAIKAHLSNIRGKIRDDGEEIICQLHRGRICYRWLAVPRPPHPGGVARNGTEGHT